MTLPKDFFARSVHEVAPELVGVTLLVDGVGGPIVEVEAYDHEDPAAHGYRGRTERNASMFGPPGHTYVYRSYGIHWCLNFVCEAEGSASAVLIRALEPAHGLDAMRERRGLEDPHLLCAGPGRLCQALGVTHALNGERLDRKPFRIVPRAEDDVRRVASGRRIGISKSIELPWRFALRGSKTASAFGSRAPISTSSKTSTLPPSSTVSRARPPTGSSAPRTCRPSSRRFSRRGAA